MTKQLMYGVVFVSLLTLVSGCAHEAPSCDGSELRPINIKPSVTNTQRVAEHKSCGPSSFQTSSISEIMDRRLK